MRRGLPIRCAARDRLVTSPEQTETGLFGEPGGPSLQTRTIGWIITASMLLSGFSGCRNLQRGGMGSGFLARGPEVQTISGDEERPSRIAARPQQSAPISSRVDPLPTEERPGAVVGQVVDDRGVPLSNARVRLAADGAAGGRVVEGTTNRSGQFLLKGLRPGDRYTLIAEWDNGHEQLIGRSSVSVPTDEVRIRVAAVGKSDDQAAATFATRDESSGVALFRRDAPGEESGVRRTDPAEEYPASPERDPAPGSPNGGPDSKQNAPGARWIPADGVQRASIESDQPTRRFAGDTRNATTAPPPTAGKLDGNTIRSAARTPESSTEVAQSAPQELFPGSLPQPLLDVPPSESFPVAAAPAAPESSPMPTPKPADVEPQRVKIAPRESGSDSTPIWRFEPKATHQESSPDSPLLMTDVPPSTEGQDESPTPTEGLDPPSGRAGAIQLAPNFNPEPKGPIESPEPESPGPESPEPESPEPESPEPELPEPSIEAAPVPSIEPSPAIEPAPSLAIEPAPLPEPEPEPTAPQERKSEPEAQLEDSLLDMPSPAPEPSRSPVEIESEDPFQSVESPEVLSVPDPLPDLSEPIDQPASSPEPPTEAPSFRWGELPVPEGAEPQTSNGPESETPEQDGVEGPKKWAAGFLKFVRRDRPEAPVDSGIKPAVQFDAERNRLSNFVFPDLNGKPYRLSQADSDYVLLCFWGTWCDPCLAAMPHLADLQQQFGPERLRVVSIAYERGGEGGAKSVARTVRRLGLNYPVLLAPSDGSCPLASVMEVQYYPTLVLLDREGRVVHRETGATSEKLMRLDRAIASAMDEGVMTMTKR